MLYSPRKFFHRCTFLCFVLALFAWQGRAALLLEENFPYMNGTLVNVSSGKWTTHSGSTEQVSVISGRAHLDASQSEDVSALLGGEPYPATTNTILYASFTLNVSTLPATTSEYVAHFKDNTALNYRAKIFVSANGGGHFRVGIANASNNPAAVVGTDLNLNTDYRVYVRYVINSATTKLWLDPASEASPSVSAADSATTRTVTSFALRQNEGIGVLNVDDLRVGTSFAEVYVPPPLLPPVVIQQPENFAVVEGGVAVFTGSATGTQPLYYQWMFNDTPLSGKTNATLNLNQVTPQQAGNYSLVVSNVAGVTNSTPATLTVVGPSSSGLLTVVHYNVKGNFAADWSTNAPQVQAIARELQYLAPDVITLNEIPNPLRYEMTNWMIAFFPGHSLAISSGTDGAIRSGVISRFPIARSQSWLDFANLINFGYAGNFTRDLFEAEIIVPGADGPLHIFTTHLKSGSDADSQERRAAESSAVSNFFATVFIPTNGHRAYLLSGDLNEDIALPMSQGRQPIQRLVSSGTGLTLTTPVNPFTSSRFTHSIQGSLDARYDYVLPAGVLAANIAGAEVFRTDVLPSPAPPLLASDSVTASDHLPVVMVFRYPDPSLRMSLAVSNQVATLSWPALIGRRFVVEASANLMNWSLVVSNVATAGAQATWTGAGGSAASFYRVVRLP
jgi:endonuclease/exonuclease/phosphatase family metal-dependent hydrolase